MKIHLFFTNLYLSKGVKLLYPETYHESGKYSSYNSPLDSRITLLSKNYRSLYLPAVDSVNTECLRCNEVSSVQMCVTRTTCGLGEVHNSK